MIRRAINFFSHPLTLGSIVVIAVFAYLMADRQEQKVADGFLALVCTDSSKEVIPTLRKIIKSEDPKNYLLLAKGLTNKGNYFGRSIPNYTEVTVVDTLDLHPEIVQIHIYRENPTSINPRNEFLWIWEGFVCDLSQKRD